MSSRDAQPQTPLDPIPRYNAQFYNLCTVFSPVWVVLRVRPKSRCVFNNIRVAFDTSGRDSTMFERRFNNKWRAGRLSDTLPRHVTPPPESPQHRPSSPEIGRSRCLIAPNLAPASLQCRSTSPKLGTGIAKIRTQAHPS